MSMKEKLKDGLSAVTDYYAEDPHIEQTDEV